MEIMIISLPVNTGKEIKTLLIKALLKPHNKLTNKPLNIKNITYLLSLMK